ncbi:PTS ascorbate transporter subunit IIC [Tetragenococcus koreensis]|uniref:PTS ascorbate transporter subunit IIC n=1 Tax=Tetragenococcus koreensis TaxID=290335 RepID=UPI000F4EF762|nr:PTS ascorbate transporter subunit IIC [Tetragenococcus koreensis]MDN6731001.1 PTS ascorbate transporter subunit IIC [Atopostipes suicloacalis]AYW46515.1 PTS ascorbate transporter subunit IIC [Tetragenococcus koreensis]MCF1585343.1 PTS ascorbate transporter subunit IIC [Tetragenococcus koreensis]MCF1619753.1 PTS ascorbate transporter subunit IIC [Tetragenococcus koreensis]MCF1629604.1 PTS ascorbate transporter subunit IIC [Tetragenococcus koreensis]
MNNFLAVITDIASTPAILVAIIAILGLVLQKASLSDTVVGGIKTFVGFLVLSAGADVVSGSLEPFGEMFQEAFNMQGVIPNNEAIIATALGEYGSISALIMLVGMIFNILIARITKYKYIFLTGHHTLYMAAMIAILLTVVGFDSTPMIIVGGLALGLIMTLSPAIIQKFVVKTTGQDNIALGHFGAVGYMLSGFIGSKLGKNSKSTEDINFPKGLSFLRDTTVSITITMGVTYLIVALFVGPSYIQEALSDGTNYILYALILAGEFAAGVAIILQGVRLILGEIVPAFKGISEKLVPDSKPALDCPIVFTYAPNAVIIGFLSSFVGGIISMLLMVVIGGVVILPGVVAHFFTGATAGVLGNATGGIKGTTIGSLANGILISFLPLALMPLMGDLGFAGATFSDADFIFGGFFLGYLGQWGGPVLVTIGVIAVLAIMIALSLFRPHKKMKA